MVGLGVSVSLKVGHVCSCSNGFGTVTMEAQKQKLSPSKTRRKSSYGTSRRSVLKKSFSQEQVTFDAWMEKGLVREWLGTVGDLNNGGEFVPFLPSPARYVATKGMRFLADSLLSHVIPYSLC